ncbi:Crp/Fnr family transcriptional regulator [Phenylobacterium deserti]|uniref:Crp/Fnr family transcriptional regulator n=1 Tax=Phenylobacterium deserti TaxID=1914756 RepID=A0A328AST4_9CAUL|nr:Crp/Fnr family transcriptional regulator [Phenylobacterium deserti]
MDLLVRKLAARDVVPEDEQQALRAAATETVPYAAGEEVVREGERQTVSRLLVSGLIARVKLLDDGRRQITELHIPGDFVDLHSFLLKRLDHDVIAVTPARLVSYPHEGLRKITEQWPHLTRLLWLSTTLDGAGHREWIVSAGRRTAAEHVGHLFCEFLLRYEVVGLGDRRRCPLPLTQQQLADACGLTPVHVNRVLQELRHEGLLEWRAGELTVPDFDRLAQVSRFDPAFLNLIREPR